MRKLFLVLWLLPLMAAAQDNGVHFEAGLSWKQVLDKAKAEHKFIFMDCYATWCVPCSYMRKEIFSQSAAGDVLNARFISVGMQMDSTAKDDASTRESYRDAKRLAAEYQVGSYPTYLFFDENGRIVHRAGGSMPLENFVQVAGDATDPDKQYYPLLERYQQGSRDSAVLRQLTLSSVSIGDEGLTAGFAEDYIARMKNVYDRDNLEFIGHFTKSSKQKGFDLWFRHAEQVNAVIGKDYAQRKVMNLILGEDAAISALDKPGTVSPNWKKIYAHLIARYNGYYADRTTKWVKISYYSQRKNWKAYTASLVAYNHTYAATLAPLQLNGFAWDVFTHSHNKAELSAALAWSKTTLSSGDAFVYTYFDTYANLLYKLNKKEEAVVKEQTGLAKAPENEKAGMQQTLEKMKQGIRTWD